MKIFGKVVRGKKIKVTKVEGGSRKGDAFTPDKVDKKMIGCVGSTFPPPEMFLKK